MSTFLATARPGITFGDQPQQDDDQALTVFDLKSSNFIKSLAKESLSFEDFAEINDKIDLAQSLSLTQSNFLRLGKCCMAA